jgi:hypothetical protein
MIGTYKRNIVACLIGSVLLMGIPGAAICQFAKDVIKDIEARLGPHFPRTAITPFECDSDSEKTMCKNNINFGEFGVNYLIKVGRDARLQTMIAMMASPAMAPESGSTRGVRYRDIVDNRSGHPRGQASRFRQQGHAFGRRRREAQRMGVHRRQRYFHNLFGGSSELNAGERGQPLMVLVNAIPRVCAGSRRSDPRDALRRHRCRNGGTCRRRAAQRFAMT